MHMLEFRPGRTRPIHDHGRMAASRQAAREKGSGQALAPPAVEICTGAGAARGDNDHTQYRTVLPPTTSAYLGQPKTYWYQC